MRSEQLKQILDDVDAEVNRAMILFQTWPSDPIHAASVLIEEAGEVAQAVNETIYEPHKATVEDVRKEAIQTAAMAVRFLISLDANLYMWASSAQHSQQDL